MKKLLLSAMAIIFAVGTSYAQRNCGAHLDMGELQRIDSIVKIIYYHSVGRGGLEQLSITVDSIVYFCRGGSMGNKDVRKSTPNELWTKLLEKSNADKFAQINSGERYGYRDGPDTRFHIETKTREFFILNGYGKDYEELRDFFKIIVTQANLCREM
jgi:hypothetical protein